MKHNFINLSLITLLSIFLFTSCTRDIDEDENPCNYTFNSASAAPTGIVNEDVPIAFNFDLASTACETDYQMVYTVEAPAGSESSFDGQAPGTSFTFSTSNYSVPFKGDKPGTYVITATATNTAADNETQSKEVTINLSHPPIAIAITAFPANNEVFVKQDAAYGFTISGGSTSDQYEVTLTRTGDDLDATINGDLGAPYTLGATIDNVNSPFAFTIAPQAVGDATYTLTVAQDGVTATEEFVLKAKAPEFYVRLQLRGDETVDATNPPITIPPGDADAALLRVIVENITPNPYNHDVTYSYVVAEDNAVDVVILPANSNPATGTNGAAPATQRFNITSSTEGIKNIIVTVTNEYGYAVTKNIYLNVSN